MRSKKSKLKKGDTVMVIAGRERGKTGNILSVNTEKGVVTVERLNMIKRHTKPTQKNRQGGVIDREGPLAISNVMLYSESVQKPSRVGIRVLDGGRKVRFFKKSEDEILDEK
ncbi:MAG: 50S ribosomal protein L24 [Nitrospirales bacterium]|nr:50S ribosomal protein L24 [Nitrospirales bacterium]